MYANKNGFEVPIGELSPEALAGLVDDLVRQRDSAAELRDLSRDDIVDLLVSGKVSLHYDVATETCHLTFEGDSCATKAQGNNR